MMKHRILPAILTTFILFMVSFSGHADDTGKLKRQLDRLQKDIEESRELPQKTDATIEELRKDLFQAALTTRDAKKLSDAVEAAIKQNAPVTAELEQLRGDIMASGGLLRDLRDRLEALAVIIAANRELLDEQNTTLAKLERAIEDRPAMIQEFGEKEIKSLRKEIASLQKKVDERDAQILSLAQQEARPVVPPRIETSSAKEWNPSLAGPFDDLAAGRIESAMEGFVLILAHDPDSLDAQIGLAACHFERGELDAARDIVRSVLKIDENNARALGVKGAILLREGNARSARKTLEKAINIDELNPYNYNYLGVVLSEMGRDSEAIQYLERAIELDPEYISAMYNLAILIASAEEPDLERARYYYLKALSFGSPRNSYLDSQLGLP